MRSKYWPFAIIFILFIAFGKAESRDHPSYFANIKINDNLYRQNVIIKGIKSNKIATFLLYDRKYNNVSNNNNYKTNLNENRSLNAQESVASSTADLVLISWWQLYLTLFGTIVATAGTAGLIISLKFNRDAIKAVYQIERPWIMATGSFLRTTNNTINKETGQNMGRQRDIALRWVNVGRSPAMQARMMIDYKIVDAFGFVPEFNRYVYKTEGMIMPPNSEPIISKLIPFSEVEYHKLKMMEKFLFIYGKVEYSDIFNKGKKYNTEVCYRVYVSEEMDESGKTKDTVSLEPMGRQNVAS